MRNISRNPAAVAGALFALGNALAKQALSGVPQTVKRTESIRTMATKVAYNLVLAASDISAGPGGGISWVSAPAAKDSSGTAGQAAYDTDAFYVCVATNSWKKFILGDW
jgi:hypothetical protein